MSGSSANPAPTITPRPVGTIRRPMTAPIKPCATKDDTYAFTRSDFGSYSGFRLAVAATRAPATSIS